MAVGGGVGTVGCIRRIIIVNLRRLPQSPRYLGSPKRSDDLVFSQIEHILEASMWFEEGRFSTFWEHEKQFASGPQNSQSFTGTVCFVQSYHIFRFLIFISALEYL